MIDTDALFRQALTAEKEDAARGADLEPNRWSVAARGKKATPDGEDEAWWLEHGPAMVQRWVTWRNTVPWTIWSTPAGDPGIELELLFESENILIKMFIDRVFRVEENELAVVDLKSGARTPESDLQLGFYAFGIEQVYGVRPKYGAYWMARKGHLSEIIDLSRYQAPLITAWVRRFKSAVEAGIFIPHPTMRCRGCGLREYCVAYGGTKSHLDPDYALVKDTG